MTTFDLIDNYMFHYISTKHLGFNPKKHCCSLVEEMNEIKNDYLNGKPMRDVIERCVCDRHGHQYCITTAAVAKAVDALMDSSLVVAVGSISTEPFLDGRSFAKFSDFEELYDFVKQTIGKINGIGPLTVYDTTKRIGYLFDVPILPKQYVYLAAGALAGAKALLSKNRLKFREPISLFAPFLGTLGSIFIEDMLCIFKNEFVSGVSTVATRSAWNRRGASLNKKTVNVTII